MQFDDNTSRQDATVQQVTVSVPMPFDEGHVCTANEAAALNQTVRENVGNNVRQKVDKLKDQGFKGDDLVSRVQDLVDDYLADYEIGTSGGGRTGDPVLAETRRLAEKHLAAWCREKGKKQSELRDKKLWRKYRDQIIDKNPALREKAVEIVAARKEDVEVEIDLED